MRIRALKPGFFLNEQLAELSPWHRLAFAGLWCCADKAGRLRDRPKRLKAQIFPYDDLDLNLLLWDLTRVGFIIRYQTEGHPYIAIPTFLEHQHPRQDEADSEIPAYAPGLEREGGPDLSTFPAVRAIDTVPSRSSGLPVAVARMGTGDLEVGTGDLGRPPAQTPKAPCRASDLMDLWNATTKPPLPRCRELTDERRQKIRGRLNKRPSLAEWREAFEFLGRDPFYQGQNDRGWVADFDYVIKNDTVVVKLLEKGRAGKARPSSGRQAWACPHTEPCGSAYLCNQTNILEAARKERAS